MCSVVVLAVALAATAVVLGVWGHYSERRPRHAGAGAGALTVRQLQAQIQGEREVERTRQLPRVRPGMRWGWCGDLYSEESRPGSRHLPGWQDHSSADWAENAPPPELMARVLARLRAL
ncbi:hypothetical protein [Actinopolyspora mortivallis]|uniref:Uncharacterized protein n=1 Tax=Actinopolyspora mortivallis TaxID=33906 RepID=A0A2T0GV26_ACTMO|nr:hypothetical protein [Actinopolyspora mortivallis]PRW62954.1 hypothetical protein CEP50_12850 [Actinopolyspora mortivallis]